MHEDWIVFSSLDGRTGPMTWSPVIHLIPMKIKPIPHNFGMTFVRHLTDALPAVSQNRYIVFFSTKIIPFA